MREASPEERSFEQRDDYGNYEANLRFLREAGLRPGVGRLLEIGSGKGRMLNLLRREGHDAQGVEVNQAMIEESRRLFGDLPIQRVSGAELPFGPASFSTVVSFDVFEHIPDSDAHLAEVKRVLRPGGTYLLQTPNKWTNSVFETIRWKSFTAWREDHCSLHSYKQIIDRFRKHGFETEFFDIPVVTDFFKWKVRRYLGAPGVLLLRIANPDSFPQALRTNFYVKARLRQGSGEVSTKRFARRRTRLRQGSGEAR